MRAPLFSALLLTMIALPSISSGQNGTGTAVTTVAATPASVTVGGTVGLTASVQANSVFAGKAVIKPTGGITFLAGITPLNTAPISLAPGGYSSATFPQTFGTPNNALTQQGNSEALGELTGDLNGDGIPDLLVYHYEPPYSVQTFISTSKGGYTAGAVQTFSFPVNGSFPRVTNVPQLIDVNGDGKLDLLCGLLVAYGNGDGTFAAAVPVSFLSSGFVTSYAADLNGDGKTDILAVNTIATPPVGTLVPFTVTVLLNQGAGSFISAGSFPVTASTIGQLVIANFFAATFVDLNGDGKLDLITQTQTVSGAEVGGDPVVDALLNNGDGTFGSPIPVSVPDPPNNNGTSSAYGAASGDVNGDGKQDLILTIADDLGNLDAITLLGNGDGTFQSPLYLTLATGPFSGPTLNYETPAVVVQDFNLDGKPDLIFSNGQLALGNADGTFTLSSPLFPAQTLGETTTVGAFPVVAMTLPGNLVPSLVFFLPAATLPAASVFTPLPSSSATLSVTSLGVGAHTITAQYSGDANYATDTSIGVAVTVSQATSTTAVTSSANPSFAGQSVTLTASVASTGPTPTGNMIFTSGSTTLGTVVLGGGSAAYTTTSLTSPGTQTIAATYSGDANTQASSATINQVINAAFTPAPASGGVTTLTVKSGHTVTTPISVTGATGFSGQVALACSGLPAGAACSFTPATVAVSGTKPATSSLTVNTGASAAAAALAVQEIGTGVHRVAYGFTFGSFLFLGVIRRRGRNTWALFGCLLLLCSLGLTACGGNSTPSGTAPGTYNFTVTATSGSLQASSNLTLNVQ
jgi:hypothetical protein